MKLKPNAAAAWLAAPLMAMMMIACGDDSDPTDTEPDGGTDTDGEAVCGNDELEEGEECDDGNTSNGDGCSSDCELQADELCGNGEIDGDEECDNGSANGRAGNACTEVCAENVCGDGHRGPGEACDDGNIANGDSCSSECGEPEPPEECGDGIVNGEEDCDEGNANGQTNSACTAACLDDTCGNGQRGPDEDCDDGDRNNDNGCSNECEIVTPPECGDGEVNGDEECDDGNATGTAGSACTEQCLNDTCGNGHLGPDEECDDGDRIDDDECTNACAAPDLVSCGNGEVEEGEDCDEGPDNGSLTSACTALCQDATCGDGEINAGEGCDDGPQNGVSGNDCTSDCAINACGDGHVGPGEGCDEGEGNSDEADATCTTACAEPTCGDGTLQGDEECDLGDDNADTATAECTEACTLPVCGDGIQHTGEECDDGANNSDVNADHCRTDCTNATCGDGVIDNNEECDLAEQNGVGGVCSSNCNNTQCGDGVVQDDEECDDANTNNNDSCLTNCQWNACGDGAVYTAETDAQNPNDVEECDDANDEDGDSCLGTCEYNVCADSEVLATITEPYGDPDASGLMTASRIGRTTGNALSVGLGECAVLADCANNAFHSNDSGTRDFSGQGQVDANNASCDDTEVCYPAPLANFVVGAIDVEACDDGNLTNTDGCVAANFDGDGALECQAAECGDGLVQAGVEDCDDQNANNNDSCVDDCSWNTCQDGWLYTVETNVSNPNDTEDCDDGNAVATDLCSATCEVLGVTTNSGISDSCGDSVIQPGEGCDNGNANSNAPGSTCTTTCRIPTCGDGVVAGAEQCDDGNADNNDQCLNTCRWNACGDGFRYMATAPGLTNNQPLEECDDANSNSNDACTPSCAWNSCGDSAVFTNTSHLPGVPAIDGSLTGINGPSWAVRGPGGAAGNATVNACNNGGTPPASAQYDDCVNSAVVEQCDDGNAVNGDGCDSCQISTCGDGTVDLGEDCDDGNVVSGDGCEANCTLPSVCGDGVTDPGEACDGDDVVRDSDGVSLGALPAGVTCLPDCRLSTCRSVPVAVQASESCDDGNDNNSDSCTNLCLEARCGDGIVQPTNNEECDDGNDVETDSCTNSCEFNVLGDGIRYTTETLEANPGNLHACDTGPVPAGHGARAAYRAGRDLGSCAVPTATCDGDGYDDETDFCGAWDDPTPANRGVIRCAPNATGRGITTWKDGDWCLMPAETHGDHGDANADDLVKASWYDAKAHCESYGLNARLVVVNTVANRSALATAADAAEVSGVANGSIAGYCEGSDEGTACAVTSEVADCDSDNCATNLACVAGATPGAACTTDADCGGGTCEGLCTATANGGNGDACVDDNDCDGPGGVCAARMSWVGLFDDFTGNSFGGTPVSTNPGRWYWLDETLDNPQNNTTKALWKHNPGPPTDLTTHPNGDGDCAVLDQGTDATVTVGTEGWDDVSCTQARAFMCEFPLP